MHFGFVKDTEDRPGVLFERLKFLRHRRQEMQNRLDFVSMTRDVATGSVLTYFQATGTTWMTPHPFLIPSLSKIRT